MLSKIKNILREIIDFGLLLIVLAIILELLFGPSSPFLGQNIIDNLVKELGDAGVVGLISIAIIIYLWSRIKKD